jgi:hypothetical protein
MPQVFAEPLLHPQPMQVDPGDLSRELSSPGDHYLCPRVADLAYVLIRANERVDRARRHTRTSIGGF